MKTPNTKHQTPTKHQPPNTRSSGDTHLKFDVWDFSGVWCLVFGVCFLVFGESFTTRAAIKDSDCLECHSDKTLVKTNAVGKALSLFVDRAKLATSVHKTNTCASCHADISSGHPDDNIAARPVNCRQCHTRQSESYGASVHGLALKAGQRAAPNCQHCHDSHEVRSPDSPLSPLYFTRQEQTCGQCHEQEARDVATSIHGRATAAGKREAPICTDCHSGHKIEGLKGGSPLKIAAQVCSKCHASERLNTKFNLPADRVKTFFESYHGLAAEYGSTRAANCASCHGYHKILPSSDHDSTIHKTHLVQTCGKCHPGASEKFALSKVHISAAAAASADLGSRINWWIRSIYLVLIVGVVGSMAAHNLLALGKKLRARLRLQDRPVLRMSRSQRWQHWTLALSFIALAVTGFALKVPDSWIARLLGSNEPFRRWAHRIFGVVLLLAGAYHLFYVAVSGDGRRLVRDFFPVLHDIKDLWSNALYLLGLSSTRPSFGRFGYAEKAEYWAVVWGTIIMGVTGLTLWFKIEATHFLPRWALDVATTIHYYEALLACLAIVVWHFYHVIFDPDVYPINPACWDGRVSEQWQDYEHPLEEEHPPDQNPISRAPELVQAAGQNKSEPGANGHSGRGEFVI
ncbi:MAG: cytochrome B [Verrucomicrobia bacterium]|nr:MAG: cytochrome B [Verrucomicrobiota bacterium]